MQHKHTCGCGLTEYEDHDWSAWTVTVEPTYTTDGDGQVTTKDTTRLMKYLAGWGVEIF